MGRADELHCGESALQVLAHCALPARVKVDLELVDQNNAGRSSKQLGRVSAWLQHPRVLRHRFDGDVGNEGKHHLLARAEITQWLDLALGRENDFVTVGVEPQAVGVGKTSKQGRLNDLKAKPTMAAVRTCGDRLAAKPTVELGESDAFAEAILEGAPPTSRMRFVVRAGVGGQPGPPGPVVADDREELKFAGRVESIHLLNRGKSLLTVGDCARAATSQRSRPGQVELIPDVPDNGHDGGTLLSENGAVSHRLPAQKNLGGSDTSPAVAQRAVRCANKPDAEGHCERIQDAGFSGAIVTKQNRELRMEIDPEALKPLEIGEAQALDAHLVVDPFDS